MTKPWKDILVEKSARKTRREKSNAAKPTTINHAKQSKDKKRRMTGVPLNAKNYELAPRISKKNYHNNMKMFYLIRMEPGDGAKANFHREIEDKMRVSQKNGGRTFDMDGNDITEEENARIMARRAQYAAENVAAKKARRNALANKRNMKKRMAGIRKARRKYPHDVKADKASQMRLDLMCENENCPAGKLNLNTMSAHGAPHFSECSMCGQAKLLNEE